MEIYQEIRVIYREDGKVLYSWDWYMEDGSCYTCEQDWDTIVHYMDDEIREELHIKMADCSEIEFLNAYLEAHGDKFDEQFEVE